MRICKLNIGKLTSLFFLILSFTNLSSQNREIDSLKRILNTTKSDSVRVNIYFELSNSFYGVNPDSTIEYCLRSIRLAEEKIEVSKHKSNLEKYYSERIASSFYNIGYVNNDRGFLTQALEYYLKALKIREEIKDLKGIAVNLNDIGLIYYDWGDMSTALDYYYRALKIQEEIKYTMGVAGTLNNIASVYNSQGDLTSSLEYFRKCLVIETKLSYKMGMAYALSNMGYIYNRQKHFEKALDYYFKALTLRQEDNDQMGIAESFNNIATAYRNLGDVNKSLDYLNKALIIDEENNYLMNKILVLNNIGYIMYLKGNIPSAIDFTEKSMKEAKAIGSPESIKNAAHTFKAIYEKQGKYKESFEMYELETKMRDSLNNEKTRKNSIKKQYQYAYQKEAIKDSISNVAKANEAQLKHEQALNQQRTYTYGGFIGLALMLVVAGVSYRAFKNKQKANVIITEQKLIAEHQKHLIEEKQKEIIDSINYARRIQRAHLPNEKYIAKKLNELKG